MNVATLNLCQPTIKWIRRAVVSGFLFFSWINSHKFKLVLFLLQITLHSNCDCKVYSNHSYWRHNIFKASVIITHFLNNLMAKKNQLIYCRHPSGRLTKNRLVLICCLILDDTGWKVTIKGGALLIIRREGVEAWVQYCSTLPFSGRCQ